MVTFTVKGLPELLGKLDRALYVEPLRRFLTDGALLGERGGKEWAPVDTGRLRASVTHAVDSSVIPLWSKAGTRTLYAEPLDQPKTRTPHYARGPRKGQLTQGWLTNAFERQKAELNRLLDQLQKAIEERWRK